MLFIISAPSGAGKSSIISALVERDPLLGYSVSATTRPPRPGEVHGRDYYFYSLEEFKGLIHEERFYEWFEVHGDLKGTLKSEVDGKLHAGRDVLLDVDVQGSLRLKKMLPNCTTVFILPPSMAELERRLRTRASDNEEAVQRRLFNARGEISLADQYDYLLVNQNLEQTITDMQTIIRAQEFRSTRISLLDTNGGPILCPAKDF